MVCPVCGSSRTKKEWNLEKYHALWYCGECRASFLSPQLSETELRELYSERYYETWGLEGDQENEVTRRMKRATFRLRLDLIRRFVGGGAILDVGCATGYFLEEARDGGFDCYGVEYSGYSAKIAKRKFGEERIFEGILEECGWQDRSFGVVAMSDLIEHVRDPVRTLSKAAALLKDGGVVMIMTPDTRSSSARLMRKRWTHYKPEHFFYFNREAMERLAERCGLRMVYYERSRKALNLDYLYTQFRTYRHWLLTPLVGALHRLLPMSWNARNFYFSIGEMVVVLEKKSIS